MGYCSMAKNNEQTHDIVCQNKENQSKISGAVENMRKTCEIDASPDFC